MTRTRRRWAFPPVDRARTTKQQRRTAKTSYLRQVHQGRKAARRHGVPLSRMLVPGSINVVARERAAWGTGPWSNEPDYAAWVTGAGLPARAVRTPMGTWCAYVAVLPGHGLFGVDYGGCPAMTCGDACEEAERHETAMEQWRQDPDSDPMILKSLKLLKKLNARRGYRRDGCGHTPEMEFDVHGGITFADDHPGAYPNDDNPLWWFGFDCSHGGDYIPRGRHWMYPDSQPPPYDHDFAVTLAATGDVASWRHGVYRTLPYVKEQAERLAAQLALWHPVFTFLEENSDDTD